MSINHDFSLKQTATDYKKAQVDSSWDAFSQGYHLADAQRDYGMQNKKANEEVVQSQDNYKQFQAEYDAYASSSPAEQDMFSRYVEKGLITLTAEGNIEWNTRKPTSIRNEDAVKGAIYSYGLKEDVDNKFASNVQGDMDKYMGKRYSNFGTVANMVGHMAQWATEPLSVIEMATPGRVIGKTIKEAAVKAFGYEFVAGLIGESFKQFEPYGVVALKRRAKLEDYYKEAFAEIGLNSIGAGLIRAGGSAVVDNIIKSKIKGANKSEVFRRYNQRMESKLITNQDAHRAAIDQTADDLDNGRPVDVQTDIDINTKATSNIQADLTDEMQAQYIKSGDEAVEIEINKAVDETTDIPKDTDLFVEKYTDIPDEFSNDEILQNLQKQMDEINTLTPEQEIEAMEAAIKKPQGFQPKEMIVGAETINKTDFDLVQRHIKIRDWNRKNPDKKKFIPINVQEAYKRHENIADDLLDMEFMPGQALPIFSGETVGGAAIGGAETAFSERDWNNDGVSDEKDVALGALIGAIGVAAARKARPDLFKVDGDVTGMFVGADYLDPKAFSDIATQDIMKELDDSVAKIKQGTWGTAEDIKAGNSTFGKLEEMLDHKELFEQYPEFKDVSVHLYPNRQGGSFDGKNMRIEVGYDTKTGKLNKSTLLHEIQHAIQTKEQWGRGGSPEDVLPEDMVSTVREQFGNLPSFENKDDVAIINLAKDNYPGGVEGIKHDTYKRLWGEQQSRDVQARMTMTPEERKKFKPFEALEFEEGKLPSPIVKRDKTDNIIGKMHSEDYKLTHTAPEPEGANSGYDMSDVFPDDVKNPNFVRWYGTGDNISDRQSMQVIKKMSDNPGQEITIYRAAPKGKDINEGDWITLSKEYAKDHGEAHLEGEDYVILEKKVKAKDVFTNGDSINEWGYYPQGE